MPILRRLRKVFGTESGVSVFKPAGYIVHAAAAALQLHVTDGEFIVSTSPDDVFVRSNLLKASDEEELFIGYPLQSFISQNGVECLCPIMMFPVSISVQGAGYTTGMKMEIDRQGVAGYGWLSDALLPSFFVSARNLVPSMAPSSYTSQRVVGRYFLC